MAYVETTTYTEYSAHTGFFGADWSKSQCKNRNLPQQKSKTHSYPNFMLKEIYEQPEAVKKAIADRLLVDDGDVFLEGFNLKDSVLKSFERISIVTNDHYRYAALAGKFLLEELCQLPVTIDLVSKVNSPNPSVSEKALVIAFSPTFCSADIVPELRDARLKGAYIVLICNDTDSALTSEADGVICTYTGLENGIVPTKSFTAQFVILYLLAIRLGRANGSINLDNGRDMVAGVANLPALIDRTLALDPLLEEVACDYLTSPYAICLGSGINHSMALEGALNLKEMSHIHTEGFVVGELNYCAHQPIVREVPVFVLAPNNMHLPKVRSCINALVNSGYKVIVFCSEGDQESGRRAEFTIHIPWSGNSLSSILSVVTLQLMAYKIAILKGKSVDKQMPLLRNTHGCVNQTRKEWSQSCKTFQRI